MDDDAAIRETLQHVLKDEGYHVETAADGIEALDTLRSTSAHMVVLLDLMMPRLDGQGVLQAVSNDERLAQQHRFVVMTASSYALNAPVIELMRRLRAEALIKPFGIDVLLDSISEAASAFNS